MSPEAKRTTLAVLTVYSDASVCNRSGAAGWGCWVRNDAGDRRSFSGPIGRTVLNSTDAEFCAAANAIHAACKSLQPVPGTLIVLVTDCLMLVQALRGAKPRKRSSTQGEATRFILDLVKERKCSLRCNKVKAHSDQDGARSYINRIVDQLAKAAMQKRRRELPQKAEQLALELTHADT